MSIRLRWVVAPIAAAAALLASSLFVHPSAPWYAVAAQGTAQSPTWAGYAAIGSKNSFSSVTASWTVPRVNTCPATGEQYSIAWVGLDGAGVNGTVEQVGTEQSCYSGTAVYRTFFELAPAPPSFSPGFAVQPGDAVHASVVSRGGSYVFTITDDTSGQSLSVTQTTAADNATAEAVFEVPVPAQAANVNGVAFSDVTVNGAPIGAAGPTAIAMVSASGRPLYSPAALAGGTDFRVRRG